MAQRSPRSARRERQTYTQVQSDRNGIFKDSNFLKELTSSTGLVSGRHFNQEQLFHLYCSPLRRKCLHHLPTQAMFTAAEEAMSTSPANTGNVHRC
jgi:hypothetical protein